MPSEVRLQWWARCERAEGGFLWSIKRNKRAVCGESDEGRDNACR